jgi:hypothetical protein
MCLPWNKLLSPGSKAKWPCQKVWVYCPSMGAVKERTFDLLGVRMKGGPDSRYGPSIGAVNEPYHAVWLNWQMNKRQTWLNVVPEHSGSRRAGGLCSGTFDLTHIRIKHKTWPNVPPGHSGNQRGLPCGHIWLNWIRIKGRRGWKYRPSIFGWINCPRKPTVNEAYHVGTFHLIDIRIKDKPGSMYYLSIGAVIEAYHVGTFDLLTYNLALKQLPTQTNSQRGLPCGHLSLNWH